MCFYKKMQPMQESGADLYGERELIIVLSCCHYISIMFLKRVVILMVLFFNNKLWKIHNKITTCCASRATVLTIQVNRAVRGHSFFENISEATPTVTFAKRENVLKIHD